MYLNENLLNIKHQIMRDFTIDFGEIQIKISVEEAYEDHIFIPHHYDFENPSDDYQVIGGKTIMPVQDFLHDIDVLIPNVLSGNIDQNLLDGYYNILQQHYKIYGRILSRDLFTYANEAVLVRNAVFKAFNFKENLDNKTLCREYVLLAQKKFVIQ